MVGKAGILSAIQSTDQGDIVAGSPALIDLESSIKKRTGQAEILREAFKDLKRKYDYVLIDAPPRGNVIIDNCLTASDGVIIPMEPTYSDLRAVEQIVRNVETVKKLSNKKLAVIGFVFNKWDGRPALCRNVLQDTKERAEELGTVVFDTKIRKCIAIQEAQSGALGIFDYAPKSNAAKDFKALAREFIERT